MRRSLLKERVQSKRQMEVRRGACEGEIGSGIILALFVVSFLECVVGRAVSCAGGWDELQARRSKWVGSSSLGKTTSLITKYTASADNRQSTWICVPCYPPWL